MSKRSSSRKFFDKNGIKIILTNGNKRTKVVSSTYPRFTKGDNMPDSSSSALNATEARAVVDIALKSLRTNMPDGSKMGKVKITPYMAACMLLFNPNNRKIGRINAESIASAIKNNQWDSDNGECIKFAYDGTLVDGQHRLLAVKMADRAAEFWVMHSVKTAKILTRTLDTGKTRNAKDILGMQGADKEFAPIFTVGWHYEQTKSYGHKPSVSMEYILKASRLHPNVAQSCNWVRNHLKGDFGCSQSAVMFAHYMIMQRDPAKGSQFFECIIDPTRCSSKQWQDRFIRLGRILIGWDKRKDTHKGRVARGTFLANLYAYHYQKNQWPNGKQLKIMLDANKPMSWPDSTVFGNFQLPTIKEIKE